MGRTGKFFSHEWWDVNPDMLLFSKGIGGGFPLGACLATDEAAKGMKPGSHGSTYGSNPLAMAVGNAVVDEITSSGFLENVVKQGDYLVQGLSKLAEQYPSAIELCGARG